MDIYSFYSEYIEFLEQQLIFAGYDLRDLKLKYYLYLTEKLNDEKKY